MANERLDGVQEVLNLKAIEQQMLDTHMTLEKWIEKSTGEIETAGKASQETKAAVDKLAEKSIALGDKIAELEQKQAQRFDNQPQTKSPGELLVESEGFKLMMQHKTKSARVEVKTAIVNDYTGGMSQPLVAGDRLNMVWHEPNRMLRIRDILPKGRTTSNTVFFPKELVFTNSAAEVRNTSVSPIVQADNVTKPESAITFTSDSEVVATIAHFIPVSKQALDDSVFLQSYVNSRLMYGLKLVEETQLLTGTGVTGYISGINTNSTAYAQADSPNLYDQSIEYLRDAKAQAQVNNYEPTVVILHPRDWSDIELLREASNGQFIVGNPLAQIGSRLWGMDVVVSNSQTAGTFTVLDPNCFMLVDREDASVEISFEDSTNFQKNMATIRAEERLALLCFSILGVIKGTGI